MAPNENGVTALMNEFAAACEPLESGDKLLRLIDERTGRTTANAISKAVSLSN